jgi:hypothetical protein
MQIINDTEVFSPSECFFAVGYSNDFQSTVVLVTDQETWTKLQCLNDCFGSHSLPVGAIPNNIHEAMESTWETEMSEEDARGAMLKDGFIEHSEMLDLYPME